ncbi:MAG: YihY/virulence factor BrkB family protein [Pseudomonadales bacterium]
MTIADAQQDIEQLKDRGRYAVSPWDIPLRGWRDVLLRVKHEAARDNLGLVAAGMAFYGMLSVAPSLAALISIYGLVVTPADVQAQITAISEYLPADAQLIVAQQLNDLAAAEQKALGWGIVFSVVLSLWSASKAMRSLFGGLNAVYDEYERRSYLFLSAQSLLFTLLGLVLFALMLLVIGVIPTVLEFLPISYGTEWLVRISSWLVIGIVVLIALAILYRFGPCRRQPQWTWVSFGALFALVVWVLASAGLSWYVASFDTYQRTYGALGAVVVMLMWFFLSAYAVLLGGELNAELEHQTEVDSTVGAARPMGQRGATVADTVGPIPSWGQFDRDAPI